MTFNRVAGTVFALVAVLQLYRVVQAIPVQIGSTSVPLWVSCVAVVVAGLLSVWGFRSRD